MRCGKDDVKGARLVGSEIQLAVGADVGLDSLEQHERFGRGIDALNRAPLIGGFQHRHPAGDLQPV